MNKFLKIVVLVILSGQLNAQAKVDRIEPPFWWAGMEDTTLQLMVHGQGISGLDVIADYGGVSIASVKRVENPGYLFIDLIISKTARPGKIRLVFQYQREIVISLDYELRPRGKGSALRQGFGREDVIYLLMPDRFSNGDTTNDSMPGMLEKADRSNPDGRHGGDIAGIRNEADYLKNLGITAVWINPLLENNQPEYSYHGYAITDYYRIDPRFGSNEDYRQMVNEFHSRGIKVIMDMVFNHCGGNHWWMRDMPMADWVHRFGEYTRSNFRGETVMDPYASAFDLERMQTGWFDRHMPDLNQHNPMLARYLIQNSVWWIEYAGLDGIRMDTYPYSYKDFMSEWMLRIRKEYPNFSVVGETWLQRESHTGWWQDGSPVSGRYRSNLASVTDFPMNAALRDAFNETEGWTTGLARLYYVLAQDFVYSDPFFNVIFADNHDLTRFYSGLRENFASYKMAMAVLLTIRGIPSIYYGTEYLMTGEESKGHGHIREDFPGGMWQSAVGGQRSVGDGQQSALGGRRSAEGGREVSAPGSESPAGQPLDSLQQEAYRYLSALLNWRKTSAVIHSGRLMQFVPQDGIYVYFRYTGTDAVMVVVNRNMEGRDLRLDRFGEMLKDYSSGRDVISGLYFEMKESLPVPARTALVLELD